MQSLKKLIPQIQSYIILIATFIWLSVDRLCSESVIIHSVISLNWPNLHFHAIPCIDAAMHLYMHLCPEMPFYALMFLCSFIYHRYALLYFLLIFSIHQRTFMQCQVKSFLHFYATKHAWAFLGTDVILCNRAVLFLSVYRITLLCA